MRYQVPQFIEVEDKIFGPLTLKQFIYLAGGAALAYLVYYILKAFIPFFIIAVIDLPVIGLGVALAFYKINNKPLLNTLEAGFKYYLTPKLYIWKKQARPVVSQEQAPIHSAGLTVPRLSDSKLKDLSWSLDISQSENPVTPVNVGSNKSGFKF